MKLQKKHIIKYILSSVIVVTMTLGFCGGFISGESNVFAADEFETGISDFPASYKSYLRELHKKYPNWKFVPYDTGIKFKTAVNKEYAGSKSLIEKSYSKYLKSVESGAYNTSSGYIAKDGASWVTASRNAIAYFLDPRNFLDDTHIYMFEQLSYDSNLQTQAGVEAILDGSFMHDSGMGYITTKGKYKYSETKYSSQIIKAAKSSKVSAYYIASKIIQEIGTSKNSKYAGMGASGSVNGQYSSKYTGIYNFYNIGAYSSDNPIANGLAWASSGSTYGRPWTTPAKSINGGAVYIGEKYINSGQNTVYFQRFNVNKNSSYGLYNHQYMTNIYGAAAEASITSDAYKEMGIAKLAKTFVIPVYKSMPKTTATVTLGKASKSGTVISSVNVRSGPGTEYKTKITLSKDDKITVTKGIISDGNFGNSWLLNPYWFKIKVKKNGKSYTGYVSASYVNLKSEKSIIKGEKVKLSVSVTSKHKVYYMSDNPAIATVDTSGNVTGVSVGSTTVRAYTYNGGMSAMTVSVYSYAPNKPTITSASNQYNSVNVWWSKEDGVSGYYLYRKNDQGKYSIIAKLSGTIYSYTDKKLTTGSPYKYKVKAYKIINGKKYKSAKSTATTVIPVPAATTSITASLDENDVVVKWNKVSGATGYKLYRSQKKDGTYKNIATLAGKKSITYKDSSTKSGKTYYYKVIAYRTVSKVSYNGKESVKVYIKR